MEISDREILQRCRESCAEMEIKDRGGRSDFVRGRQMGRRLRSTRQNPVARFGVSEAGSGKGNLGLFVGLRFSTAALERGRKQMECDAPSIHAAEGGRRRAPRS